MTLLALPAGAFGASTAAVSGNLVTITGDAGANAISLSLVGTTYTVNDTTGVTPGAGCTAVNANQATCDVTGVPAAEIVGGEGDDTIIGSAGPDRIHGGDGGDTIDGGGGGDIINSGHGAPGFDDVTGGQGFDTLTYEDRTGPISVDLRPGRDIGRDDDGSVDAVNAIERVEGGLASDVLVGGLGSDTLSGGPGNAPDTLCGGLGKDTVDYSDKSSGVTVTLDGVIATDPDIISSDSTKNVGARQDCRLTIKATTGLLNGQPCGPNSYIQFPSCRKNPDPNAPGPPEPAENYLDCTPNDGVAGENDCVGEDVENVIGSPQDDLMIGNNVDALYGQGPRVEPAGENVFEGRGGNDTMNGLLGADIYQGGDGDDAVSYEDRSDTDPVLVSIDGAANDGSAADLNAANNLSDQVMGDVEDLIGGDGADTLKGNNSNNVLLGGPGDDLIQGHGGDDTLGGDEGADLLEGGEGGDAMEGGPDDDYLFGGFGNDSYDGGDGLDAADFSDATTPVSVTLNGAADDGRAFEGDNVASTIEGLFGGIDDDKLNANDSDGFIDGGGGNDLMNGGLGADLLTGGAGNDMANYGSHPGPVDVSLGSLGGDGMPGENDQIAPDVEGIGGSVFDDVLSGDGQLNFINGGAGNDRISGAEGDDQLAGDVGNDTINGDEGADTLDGAEGNDTLNGAGGNDTMRGFTGTDILDGGPGADTMSGGDGVDTVTYASRTGDVSVDTLGSPNDGEKGENDLVRTDVESARTGSGDDDINVADGAAGGVTCGGGVDVVRADADDEIGSGCEAQGVTQSSVCKPASKVANVSKSATVSVRLRCGANGRGTLQLKSAGKVRTGKGKRRKLNLGKKSFTGKRGQIVTVKVKMSKSARKALKGRKRLRAEALLSVRRDGSSSAMRTNRTKLTLRVSGK
jgi:Ca2+-binding RTX toxin-like protein